MFKMEKLLKNLLISSSISRITSRQWSSDKRAASKLNLLESEHDRLIFYREEIPRFPLHPQAEEYWRYLMDMSPLPEDSTDSRDLGRARQSLLGTQASLLPENTDLDATMVAGLKVPSYVLDRACGILVHKRAYVHDPGWIYKYTDKGFKNKPYKSAYNKFAVSNLLISHVRDRRGELHRLVVITNEDDRVARAIGYYPSGDYPAYQKMIAQIKARHYFNCSSYMESFEAAVKDI